METDTTKGRGNGAPTARDVTRGLILRSRSTRRILGPRTVQEYTLMDAEFEKTYDGPILKIAHYDKVRNNLAIREYGGIPGSEALLTVGRGGWLVRLLMASG